VLGQAAHFARSLTVPPAVRESTKHHRCISLQGSGPWDTIWEPLVDFAESHGLAGVKIDLNMAWLHEGYHANWQSIRLPDKETLIRVKVPLFTKRGGQEVQIGRLELAAPSAGANSYVLISDISDQLADLGPAINQIVLELEAATIGLGAEIDETSSADAAVAGTPNQNSALPQELEPEPTMVPPG